jgi:preprotein translocase subunit SecD
MGKRKELFSLLGIVAVALVALLANVLADNTPALGLDLQGGASVTLEPVGEYESDAIDIAKDIIQQRVDSLGIAEPEVIRQGDTIVVNLPGVKNQEEALELVGRTGAVQLRPVLSYTFNPTAVPTTDTTVAGETATTVPGDSTTAPDATATTAATDASTTAPATTAASTESTAAEGPARQPMGGTTAAPTTTAAPADAVTTTAAPDPSTTVAPDSTVAGDSSTTAAATATTTLPGDTSTTTPVFDDPTQQVTLPSEDGSLLYTLGPAGGTGEVFTNDADAVINGAEWMVTVGLRGGAAGEDLWNALAAQCYSGAPTCPPQSGDTSGRGQMAIVLDGVVISAPTVNEPNFAGEVSITGSFSESEARDLAKILKFGAVPVRMEPQAAETVSATLGKDSLDAAILSGLLGLALVVAFMVFYYRTFALIIVGGLALSAALQWSIISILSKTQGLALTLSGVAGIIVSIGITVDSFVVLFERVKDELQHGRTLRVATARGVAAGWRTTLAANTVSLLGALVLWWLTVGSVRGFAFFLGLSTAIDLLILWFFTRPSVLLLGRSKKRGHRLFGVDVAQSPSTARASS